MSRKSSVPDWLVPAIIGAGVVSFFLSKSAFGATKKKPSSGNVQTETVGDRVYSVARLGQGHYIISLISTGGVIETSPVTYSFNQTEQLGSFGDERKLAQLRTDLNSFDEVNFG
jgi:hypothetical protein